jgi:hypothetical protein
VNVGRWLTNFINTAGLVNTNTGANPSVLSPSAGGAGGWDPTILTSNASNWYSNGPTNAITGLNTTATLYDVAAVSNVSTTLATNSSLGNVELTSAGLIFLTSAPVPLPAAFWLLGSGLLGLFGIGRRKTAAV